MRRVPIRTKLAAALAIPLVALGVVTVLEVTKAASEARDVGAQTDLARATLGPTSLTVALQNERNIPASDLVGFAGQFELPVKGYDDSRAATNQAIDEFRTSMAGADPRVREAFEPALAGLDDLEQIRADIDASTAPKDTSNIGFSQNIFDRYSAVIAPFFDATTRVSAAVNDPELRLGTELADLSARQVETLSLMMSGTITTAYLSSGGIDTAPEIAQISTWLHVFRRNAEAMQNPGGAYQDLADAHFPVEVTATADGIVVGGLETHTVVLDQIMGALQVPREEGYIAYQDAVAEAITDRADDLQSAADTRKLLFSFLALLVISSAAVLTWLVSRSITRPLRSLTQQAKVMAESRLPDAVLGILETPLGEDVAVPTIEPVQVQTRDEVADVADALNTVQDTALELAVEQAVLRRNIADSFVNLGRRNQNLLGRQLDFITELETNETDPDTLADLFRLDHLATRMRRNAESLLVLAGIEPPRQWAAPVRLTDVIRAALGEVEDYQRVTVRGVEPATILGSAAADLAHLLAELVENALVFSPPDQTVDIRGRARTDGYTLAIIDSGLGMPASDVAAANRRLAGTESFTIAPSKYLGHYVAGNLAARHGIRAYLDNSPGNGITATVELPADLLTNEQALPQADEPHAAREVWPPAPIEAPPGRPELARRTGPVPVVPSPLPAGPAPGDGGIGRTFAYPRAQFGAVPTNAAPIPALRPGDGPLTPPWQQEPPAAPPAAPAVAPAARADDPPWLAAANAVTSSSPVVPAAPAVPPADAGETRRTPSGLVKRTPRVVDTHEVQAVQTGPSDDLLASLSRYASGRDLAGVVNPRPALPQRPPSGAPPAPPLAPAAHTPPPADTPPPLPSRGQAPGGPGGLGRGGRQAPDPFGPPPSGPQPSGPQPNPFGPGAGTGPRGPASGPGSLSGAFGGGLGAGFGGGGALGHRPPPAAPASPAPDGDGVTSGGLARRVRGAQMPATSPLAVRRAQAASAPPQGQAPAPARPPQAPPSADAVYSFLTSFSAGIQRGLDETRRSGNGQ
ncbi:MAG TPA: nitrate- and nitrite sensing domain-containing protein [Acidimicrobiales bacterium]|nr:nitrate- and nitrite sensing domain-containing protein [Acidimicrobiales bacterium]